jgi:hypothetical protein
MQKKRMLRSGRCPTASLRHHPITMIMFSGKISCESGGDIIGVIGTLATLGSTVPEKTPAQVYTLRVGHGGRSCLSVSTSSHDRPYLCRTVGFLMPAPRRYVGIWPRPARLRRRAVARPLYVAWSGILLDPWPGDGRPDRLR